MEDKAILEQIRKRFELAQDAESDQRDNMLEDMNFENGDQWDEEAKTERDDDGRPTLTINKVHGMVKLIVGDMRQNMPGIKVRPVDNQADPKVAELLTGIIRNIENTSEADNAYDKAGEDAVRGGLGYFRILTEYADDDVFEQDICIKRVENPFTIYRDPYSRDLLGRDAKFYFVSETISKEEFKERYPNADMTSFQFDSDDNDANWVDETDIRVAEYWWVEEEETEIALLSDGRTVSLEEAEKLPDYDILKDELVLKTRKGTIKKVQSLITNGHEVLEGPTEWAGKYIPIVPVPGEEIWIENKRYYRSAIHFAKDPQRLYNWARSTACETLAMAPRQPWLVTPEMIDGFEEEWADANRKPMPYLMYNEVGGVPQRQGPTFPDNGSMAEALASADEIKATTGIYDASLGARSNETSGRAIIARQREGDTATFVYHDNLNKALKYAGKILVDLIPKIYDTERVVRLLNVDGSEAWARINQKVLNPMTGEESVLNDLSVGKYDVVVDTSANYQTKRLEAADSMVEFVRSFPASAPVVGPRLAQNLDWPEAQEIAAELKALTQPQQQPDPMQVQMLQLQMQKLMLENEKIKAGIMTEQQKVQVDAMKTQGDLAEQAAKTEGQQIDNVKSQMEIAQTIQDRRMMQIAEQVAMNVMRQFTGG